MQAVFVSACFNLAFSLSWLEIWPLAFINESLLYFAVFNVKNIAAWETGLTGIYITVVLEILLHTEKDSIV